MRVEVMAIKNDIEEVQRLIELRDDTEYRLVQAMDKITRRMTETQAEEVLNALGVVRVNVDGVLVPMKKTFVDFWRECEHG